jgi:hypothetical protein
VLVLGDEVESIKARNVCIESCAPYFVKRLGGYSFTAPQVFGARTIYPGLNLNIRTKLYECHHSPW